MVASINSQRKKALQLVALFPLATWVKKKEMDKGAKSNPYEWPRSFLVSYAISNWDAGLDKMVQDQVDKTKTDYDPELYATIRGHHDQP